MKALSIRQPWAWAICNAGKRVENRAWLSSPGMVGAARKLVGQDILIHAAQSMPRREFEYAKAAISKANGTVHVPALAVLPHGAIVAKVKLVDVYDGGFLGHRRHDFGRCSLCGKDNPTNGELVRGAPLGGGQCPKRDPWAMDGQTWLILDDVRPIVLPVAFKGSLGFFEVPDYLIGGAS